MRESARAGGHHRLVATPSREIERCASRLNKRVLDLLSIGLDVPRCLRVAPLARFLPTSARHLLMPNRHVTASLPSFRLTDKSGPVASRRCSGAAARRTAYLSNRGADLETSRTAQRQRLNWPSWRIGSERARRGWWRAISVERWRLSRSPRLSPNASFCPVEEAPLGETAIPRFPTKACGRVRTG